MKWLVVVVIDIAALAYLWHKVLRTSAPPVYEPEVNLAVSWWDQLLDYDPSCPETWPVIDALRDERGRWSTLREQHRFGHDTL